MQRNTSVRYSMLVVRNIRIFTHTYLQIALV